MVSGYDTLWYRVGCSDRDRDRSMDKSVHPPASRAEAVHSCAASVAAIATAPSQWTRVSIILQVERRRHTLVPRGLQRSLPRPVNGQECPSSCKSNGGGTLLCRVGCSDRDRARPMDKSVHPPVNRTEAVHSCAAWVALQRSRPCPVYGQECPSSCKSNGGGTLLCRVGCSDRYRPRSMDKSVHPPANRTEAAHSCAAWVAAIATAPSQWTRVSILL